MVVSPFTDTRPTNSVVVPVGGFDFLQVALHLTVGGAAAAPDPTAFQRTDVRRIYNPAGQDVTALFATNGLDPVGLYDSSGNLIGPDVYDAAHATYVGDEASPNNVGLFYDNTNHIAQKIQAPNDQSLISDQFYRIVWQVLKGGGLVTKEEFFKVGPAGVLVFDVGYITPAEVKAGMVTSLTDPQIEDLIEEASNYIIGWIEASPCRAVYPFVGSIPRLVRTATIWATRALIWQRDAGAYGKVTTLREGDTQLTFSGNSQKDLAALWDLVNDTMMQFCGLKAGLKKPRFNVIRHGAPGHPDWRTDRR